MRERLKGFDFLCDLEAFKKLRATMQVLIDELKGANLFRNFSDKHPGIEHKAGVTLGGTFIVVYHRGKTTPDNPDEVYKTVSGELADRIVVADFYLPYLSYSSAPPIVYQVVDAEPVQEDGVTLELQPNPKTGALVFSVGDETPTSSRMSPTTGR